MKGVIDLVAQYRLVPVIAIQSVEQALRLARILTEKEFKIMEITFRSSVAADAIRAVKKDFPEMIVGAGTLVSRDSIDAAIDAGAVFFVSPGFNPVTVEYAISRKIPFVPGVTNPSLVEQALEYGLDFLKFFPAEYSGGTGMLKALAAVYPHVNFMPTGGINIGNVRDYLSLENVVACGASWFVGKSLIQAEKWDEIERAVTEARRLVLM